ncbi:hypothetical protein FAZ15_03635 [Sphingobacterium olei]|uniref:Tetratricopeptide repeat protein n=1 Tax=Sphingobacterium olei TaxID=2571155 RepID=A0A4U0PKC1_9SPHI|nr:hypothetical protein [Sphingobacterium olei]TJZ63384.1 hypothetical protein FAZ15_03635 [Sphingobacterium olei]
MANKYQDLIDDYLRDKLDEEQRREVERLADTNEHFRTELDFHKQTKLAFANQQHERLKKRLQSLSDEAPKPLNPNQPTNRFGKSFWFVAATVLLISSIGLYVWSLKQSEASPMDLYIVYFEPYPNVALPVTRDETQLNEHSLAYSYYEQAEYAKAYELFENLLQNSSIDDPEIFFYKGISAMQLNLNDEAIALFNKYKGEATAKLERQAKWYEALTRLKQGDKVQTRKLLQYLADDPGYKQTEAIRLLKQY